MNTRLFSISTAVFGLCALAGAAGAAVLSDSHISGVEVHNSGYVGGDIALSGVDIGFHYESPTWMSCGTFVNGSDVDVDGTSATFTAECGAFDVEATVRLLSPLPSLPSASAGYEIVYVFTNTAMGSAPLDLVRYMDPDLGTGGIIPDDIANRDPVTGAITDYDSAADPDVFLAAIAESDHASTLTSWELGNAGAASHNFPLANNAGPYGPADIGLSQGFQMVLAAGESATLRFRTIVARGVSALPADFDMSSCYTTPVACRIAAKGQLTLKDHADDAKDQLKWKFQNGEATTVDEFGVPTATSDASLCIYDSLDEQIVGLHVPASSTNWVPAGDKGYKYKEVTGANHGITKGQLKAGVLGKSQISLQGKGVNLPDPTLGGVGLPVTVQFHSGGQPGNCWESTLATQLKNDASQLKVKAP